MPIKIALVNPPFDALSGYEGPERSPYPPLALLALATFLKVKNTNADIEILDGQVMPFEEIIEIITRISPAVVGISPFSPTYWNALKIARLSKKIGAKVVLGGHHAASLAKEILLLRGPYSEDYCVDCVVQNDGEKAFYRIVRGDSFDKISNVIFSPSPGVVKENNIKILNYDKLPIADRSLINLEPYFKINRALNVFSKIGCRWRSLTGSGCIFCSRMHNDIRCKSPTNFWREIDILRRKHVIETIFDGRDDFLDDDSWLRRVYELSFNYPDKPALTIFSRANKITLKTAKVLKKMNVSKIILGLESGDQQMLTIMRKGTSSEMNRRAIRILSKEGIGIFASFLIGAPQENKKSIHNTIKFANEIKRLFNEKGVPFSIKTFFFTPRPGSLAFQWLLERTGTKYYGKDIWNRDELLHDWVNNFCKVRYKDITAAIKEMNSLNDNCDA